MATSSRPSAFPWTGISLLFVGALVVATTACTGGGPRTTTNPVNPSAATSAAPAPTDDEVARLTASLRAAIRSHDTRFYHQLRSQLAARIGAETIKAADDEYRQVMANLTAANAAGDAKARAEFRSQLRALCSPTSLTSAIEFCEADLVALGG